MSDTLSVEEYRALKKQRKYRNRPVKGTHTFASVAEAKRYSELLWLEKAGDISELEVHPRFSLDVNGVHIGRYTADFSYRVANGKVVEDCKSPATRRIRDWYMRKNLMKAIHGIDIVEVTA